MRRYMAIARIFLFLSTVRFALAAPIVVRQVHEVHANVVDVAEDKTATLHMRREPWDDWLTNAADRTGVPMIPAPRGLQDLQDLDHRGRSSTESNIARSSPASSTRLRPRLLGDSPPPSPRSTDDSHPSYYQSPSSASSTGDSPPSTLFTETIPPFPSALSTGDPPPPHRWFPPSTLFTESIPPFPSALSTDDSHLTSSLPEPDDSPPTDHSPPSNPDHPPPPPLTLTPASSTGPHQSMDDHPQSNSEPPRPTEPETKDFLSQLDQLRDPPSSAEPETKDVLGLFLKGKFKRRISGPGAVNSV